MSDTKWTDKHFRQRAITVSGPGLANAQSIEVILRVDGKTVAHLQAREPGMVAVVSRAVDEDIAVVVVQPMGVAYTDADMPGDGHPQAPERWVLEALGLLDG